MSADPSLEHFEKELNRLVNSFGKRLAELKQAAFKLLDNCQQSVRNGVLQGGFDVPHTLQFQNNMSVFSAKKPHRARPKDDKERYYLLPGQGGSSYRRKQWVILKSAILVGLVVSAIFALMMYLAYQKPH